jgi:hypothetical protein
MVGIMTSKIVYRMHKKDFLLKYQGHKRAHQQFQAEALAEAQVLATILVEEYGAQCVYAFGPLTYGEFSEGMSIELAVEGISSDRLASALGQLKQHSAFGVDVIDIAHADSWAKRAILEKGTILAGRS